MVFAARSLFVCLLVLALSDMASAQGCDCAAPTTPPIPAAATCNEVPWSIPNGPSGTVAVVHQAPANPATPRRLIVIFHGYGQQCWPPHANSAISAQAARQRMFDAADARGWDILSFPAADDDANSGNPVISYGGPQMHARAEAAIEYVLEQNPTIDRDFIYGFGYSMGGGDVLNYAARHLDDSVGKGGVFASVYARSPAPSASLIYSDPFSTPPGLGMPLLIALALGLPDGTASPTLYPFDYAKASTVELGGTAFAISEQSMAHNLSHLPLLTSLGQLETNTTITNPTEALVLLAAGEKVANPAYFSNYTHWTLANQTENISNTYFGTSVINLVYDQFELASRSTPDGALTLTVDDSRKWFHFHVQRKMTEEFGQFEWKVDGGANQLDLLEMKNLWTLVTSAADLTKAGLDLTNTTLIIETENVPGQSGLHLGITEVPLQPIAVEVEVNGTTHTLGYGNRWSWSQAGLRIEVPGGSLRYTWRITFP